jgi:hypothetical protein
MQTLRINILCQNKQSNNQIFKIKIK